MHDADAGIEETVFKMKRVSAENVLTGALIVAVLDCVWLSWRYIALKSGWVVPGTGLCSWTPFIDCDKVLQTPEARAFYVPNALLGFSFFFGSLVWWWLGNRFYQEHRGTLIRLLAVWLGLATLMTFWFFWLLFHLSAFCPFCPWNHLFTYIAFGAAVVTARGIPGAISKQSLRALAPLIVLCVGQFFAVLIAWRMLLNR
ncbi:MAG: vitamin K epoxide reductase family protein [Planctomycetota bacterium]